MAAIQHPQPPNERLEAALAYAARGWRVFPVHAPARNGGCTCGRADCTNIGKHPVTKNGLKDGTTDETTIRAWWARWPWANVAVVTGATSGLLVVDVDVLKGGDESFKAIQAQYDHAFTNTLTGLTGGGGWHLLYAHPGADTLLRNTVRLDGYAGLDIRGDGGYIVAPPSRHASGARYQWHAAGDPVRPMPQWLLPLLLRARDTGPESESTRKPGEATADETARATAHWTATYAPQALEGARNAVAFKWACQLRDDGVSQMDAEGAAGGFYDALTDTTGFALREVYACIRSAYRTAPRGRAKSLAFRTQARQPQPATPATKPQNIPTPITDGTSARQLEPEQTAEPTPRFRFMTDAEVEQMPPPEWLIGDHLPAGRLSVIFGEYGSAKSFLALDWALRIATGKPWMGQPVKAGVVAYVAGEGIGGLGKRIRAWKARNGWTGPTKLYLLGDPPQLLRAQDIVALCEAIRTLPETPQFIVIDTLARSMVGGNENDQEDMGLAVAAADRLRIEFGAHVALLHHKPHGADRTRGSTVLPGAADTLIKVVKDGDLITVSCDKQKDYAAFDRAYLRLEVVALDDYADQTSCVLTPTEPGKKQREERAPEGGSAKRQELLTHLRASNAGMAWGEMFAVSNLSKSGFNKALGELCDEGRVCFMGGKYYANATTDNQSS